MKKYLVILVVFISFLGCRTVKKEWVKDTFAEKTELSKLQQDIAYSNETLKFAITETVNAKFTEKLHESTTNTSESENSTTSISGNITAEDGKEKSVTVGDTKITTNGANVFFETVNTKAISKAFETKYQELNTKFQEEQVKTTELQHELTSLKSEFANFRSSYNSEKESQSKSVKVKEFSWKSYLWLLLVVAIALLIWKFKR